MKTHLNTLVTMLVGVVTVATCCADRGGDIAKWALPHDFQISTAVATPSLPLYVAQAIIWPTDAAASVVTDVYTQGVTSACEDTWLWMKKIIKPHYLPPREEVQMVALQHDRDGCDTVRCRYRAGKYVIQVASLSHGIDIVVSTAEETVPQGTRTTNEIMAYARMIIAEVFNNGETIISNECVIAEQIAPGALRGKSTVRPDGMPLATSWDLAHWWGWGEWISDGSFLYYGAPKMYDVGVPRVAPRREENWFTEEQRRCEERQRRAEIARQREEEERQRVANEERARAQNTE